MKANQLLVFLVLMTSFLVLAEEGATSQTQTLLEKSIDLKSTKVKARVFRVVLPKGFKTPVHVHEGPGPRYVVKGRVKIEEAGQSQEYGPGQVFWESGEQMTAENISDGEAELIIFEVSPQK